MSTTTLTEFPSHNPATGEVIGTHRNFTQEEVDGAVAKARASSKAWQGLGYSGRKKILVGWAGVISARLGEITDLVALETGKPKSDASLEISLAIGHLDWAAKNAARYLSPVSRNPGLIMANMKARVERAPYGVVGVIGPWNYPVFTPMGSIAYSLAAGNTVLFKPSEYTPGVGEWLGSTFAEVAPFADIFQVVTGLAATGQALTNGAIDKIAFTGSTRTAKRVAAAAAERMIPTVLECGGKDPVIVDSDANIKKAAEYALWLAMSNAGQTCIGAERVYVHHEVADQFVREIGEMAREVHPGVNKSYGPATMPSQLNVIQSHIDDAVSKGATFLIGGIDSVQPPYVQPTIMLDVPEDSLAITEETFGPTLTINRVQSMDEAIALANATRYGLGASVWSKRNGEKIASQLITGMVSINSVIGFAGIATVPFGGVKDSGYGRIHGPEGLHEFTYLRSVVTERFALPFAFTTFKRTKFADKFLTSVIKFLH
jgi:acyl-CoA reductase-like NAD-dependent aldehyde dehydrogenase